MLFRRSTENEWNISQNFTTIHFLPERHSAMVLIYIYIRDSQLNRPESVSLASLALNYIVTKILRKLEKWFPLQGERGRSSYFRCFQK